MSINEEYIEIPVVLRLKKNIAEAAKILSICYSDYPTTSNEILNFFISREFSKIVETLVQDPPGSQEWPENFKNYLKRLLNDSATTTNDDIIKKYTTRDLISKEKVESRFGKIPLDDDKEKEDLK